MNLIDKAAKWKRRNKPFIWSWLVLFAVDIVAALIILIAYSRKEHIKIRTPEIKNQALCKAGDRDISLAIRLSEKGWKDPFKKSISHNKKRAYIFYRLSCLTNIVIIFDPVEN